MEQNPSVSVVILNWNGCRLLEGCLASVRAQSHVPLEIIVTDNGSTDGSVALVKERFPEAKVILNERNLGFGGGNNVAIRASQGRYILLLNNDTTLHPNCIEELKSSIDRDPRYGASAPKILLSQAPHLIDAAGMVVCPDGLSIGRGRLEQEERYDRETEVFFASGCACLFRREMLETIGLYDEDFFAYAEDTDLGWRARLADWKCIYTPRAIVYHLHSASSGTYSQMKAFLVERNRIWLAIKNFPFSLLLRGQAYTLRRYFWQAYGALTGKGAAGQFTETHSKTELLMILLRVYISVLKSLPVLLRKRRMIQERKRISNRDVYRLLRIYGISAKEIALRG